MALSGLLGGRQKFICQPILTGMNDTARDYQHAEPADTEGLDDIFDVRELGDELDANLVRLGANPEPLGANSIPVDEAAKLLGISSRAVQKRLKKGTLAGWKEKTITGERWLVDASNLTANQAPNPVRLDANPEPQGANSVPLCSDVREPVREPYQPDAFVLQLQNKLEAATYRIGYLEAVLENQRDQIKLLTDSQQDKPSFFSRLKTWFLGG